MLTEVFELDTGSEPVVVDLTARVTEFVAGAGDGLVNVFAPHATAGLALIETGAGTESDLWSVLDELLPRDERWRHRHGSRGHGGDHVLPAFIVPSLSLPVVGGQPILGTWQSVVLVDPNRDNRRRRLHLSFIPG